MTNELLIRNERSLSTYTLQKKPPPAHLARLNLTVALNRSFHTSTPIYWANKERFWIYDARGSEIPRGSGRISLTLAGGSVLRHAYEYIMRVLNFLVSLYFTFIASNLSGPLSYRR